MCIKFLEDIDQKDECPGLIISEIMNSKRIGYLKV